MELDESQQEYSSMMKFEPIFCFNCNIEMVHSGGILSAFVFCYFLRTNFYSLLTKISLQLKIKRINFVIRLPELLCSTIEVGCNRTKNRMGTG